MIIKLNESTAARRRVPVALVDDTDGKTPETGITLTTGDMKVSKNGAAEDNHTGTLIELAGGDYYYEFASGEVDTAGYITGRIVKSGVRTFRIAAQIVAFDPYDTVRLGLTSLPNATAGASGGVPTGDASGHVVVGSYASGQAPLQPTTAGRTLDVSATGEADANIVKVLGSDPTLPTTIDANIVAVTGGAVTNIGDFKTDVTVASGGIPPTAIPGETLTAIGGAVRDIDNTSPAADSFGESVNNIPGSEMDLIDGAITEDKVTMPTEQTGAPTTFFQIVLWIAGQLGLRKVIKDKSAGTVTQYMANNTTVKSVSDYSENTSADTLTKAS